MSWSCGVCEVTVKCAHVVAKRPQNSVVWTSAGGMPAERDNARISAIAGRKPRAGAVPGPGVSHYDPIWQTTRRRCL
jgi:hypothetical protein